MVILFRIINELGEFESEEMTVTSEQYVKIKEMSKNFYEGGYEMYLPNGFLVMSPEIVRKSILIIDIVESDLGTRTDESVEFEF